MRNKKTIITMMILIGLFLISVKGQHRCCEWSHPMFGQCSEIKIDSKTLIKHRISCVEPIINQDERYRGAVPITFIVNTEGVVDCAVIHRGLPDGIRQTVLEAVKRWKFKPFKIKNQPVAVTSITAVSITGIAGKNCAFN